MTIMKISTKFNLLTELRVVRTVESGVGVTLRFGADLEGNKELLWAGEGGLLCSLFRISGDIEWPLEEL